MLLRTFKILRRFLLTVFIGILLLLAIYVSLGRYYISMVEQYQDPLREYFTELTGIQIGLSKLSAKWSHFSPTFQVRNLRVLSQIGEMPINSDYSAATVDVFNTILSRQLSFSDLHVIDAELQIEQTQEGSWQVAGFASRGSENVELQALLNFVDKLAFFKVFDLTLALKFNDGRVANVNVSEVSLERSGSFRRVKAKLRLDDQVEAMTIIAELKGSVSSLKKLVVDSHVNINDVDIAPLLPLLESFGIETQGGNIRGEMWAQHNAQDGWDIAGKIDVYNTELIKLLNHSMRSSVESLSADFAVVHAEHGWQMFVSQLDLTWTKGSVELNNLIVHRDSVDSLSLQFDQLPLGTIKSMAYESQALPEKLENIISTLSPEGLVEDLVLSIPLRDSAELAGIARLTDISLKPWRGAPGISGVNGIVEFGSRFGVVDLETEQLSLEFPGIYQKPLLFDSANAQIEWRIDDGNVYVNSGNMQFTAANTDAKEYAFHDVSAALSLDLPLKKSDESKPKMDLAIGFTNMDASDRERYIPSVLDKGLRRWLSRSISAGWINKGNFIYRGALNKSAKQERSVQLYLDVADVALNYHKDWPAVDAVNGQVFVDNGRVRVLADKGKIYNSRISDLSVEVANDKSNKQRLALSGVIEGSAKDAFLAINTTPIRQTIGDAMVDWQASGKLKTQLNLGLFLNDLSVQPDVDLTTRWQQGKLSLPSNRLQFTHINGPISYSNAKGLNTERLDAKFFNRPLKIDIAPGRDDQGDIKATRILAETSIAIRDLREWTGLDLLAFADGTTKLNAEINISGQGNSLLIFRSGLEGVEIDLPSPLGKDAATQLPLEGYFPLGSSSPRLSMRFAKLGDLLVRFRKGEYDGGLFTLGVANTGAVLLEDIKSKQFLVNGSLDYASYEQWLQVVDRYQDITKSNESTSSNSAAAFKVENLDVRQLAAFGETHGETSVSISPAADGWLFGVKNERLLGNILWSKSAPLAVTLDDLNFPENDSQVQKGASFLSKIDPRQLINADVTVKNLWRSEKRLGEISFSLRNHADGVNVEDVWGSYRGVGIGTQEKPVLILWNRYDESVEIVNGEPAGPVKTRDVTRFQGDFVFKDLGDVLSEWGYDKIIETKKGKLVVNASWPGALDEFQLVDAEGSLVVDIGKGRFNKASQGASNALAVIGVLDVTKLISQFRFDFNELFDSGVPFESIDGQLDVENGTLEISKPIDIKGSSSRFKTAGSVDLMNKDLDLELIATLPIGSNLPWLAALAGGLPAAAGAFVVSKIFEKQVDRLSSAVYAIEDDWNKPKVKFQRIFDDSAKKKKKKKVKAKDEPIAPVSPRQR